MRLDHLLSKEQPPSVWVGKPHGLCVVLIFGWNVTKTLMMHSFGCVVCVCCVLFGWGMQWTGRHVVGLWGNRLCVVLLVVVFVCE